ncbi:MAG: hypothetical protein PHS56_00975 [Eubacteriales bacterium]|nr:hypothetical protein [Eubacteriales bacterium]
MKRFKIIGAVILAAVVVVLLLLPDAGSMEKYEDMYQRGLYDQVSRSLQRELERKPQWHEARKLLVKAELKQNRLDSAVLHLLALEGEDIDISSLALLVDDWLLSNKLSPAQAKQVLELLSRRLEAKATCPEIVGLYLQLVAEYQDASHIPGALKLVMEAQIDFESEMLSLIFQALARLNEDVDTLWDTGIMLDDLTDSSIRDSHMLHWRYVIMRMASPVDLDSLREKHPGDAYLAVNHALLLEPAAGLAFLRGWEQQYVVDDSAAPFYSQLKLELLQNADSLDQGDFVYLEPQELMNLALTCTDQPAKCQVILDWLEQHNYDPDMVQAARVALKGPQPCLRLPGFVVSISPDGKRIIRRTTSGIYINNIQGGEAEFVSQDYLGAVVFWTSDSSKFVLHYEYNGDTKCYSAGEGICRDLDFGGQAYKVLGWHGPNTLWIREMTELNRAIGPYLVYNIDTDEILTPEEEPVPVWAESLFPGPEGALAWSGKNKFWMLKGEKTLELSAPGDILGWIPDGSGLIFDIHGQIRFWTGGELLYTEAKGKFLGWRNDRVFYWTPESLEFGVSKLMGYDLKTGEIIDYQLLGNWTAVSGKIAAAGKNNYQLLNSYAGYGFAESVSLIYYLP